ncbi:MAG: diguanylate cyclase [Nitrospinaceae bacterium]|jgi:diguanylate cyclase (GGDEF)-like protein|nr:diguanylate cyclase [Nitrospina sp.]MBT5868321.1 diguanylate cyclase [Nitrospinaceae bacterium]MBT6347494.1 diguanylate cyclase [Nitrospina sp.]
MNNDNSDLVQMKILLVDDVPLNIEILFKTLRTRNYQIFMADNGVKALELVTQIQPDLILLDIMMPEMDGIETCRRLKADEATRDIPVIFITAKTSAEDVLEGFNVGGVDYINKPFRLQEVLARVETQLRLRKTLRDKDNLISELRDTHEVLLSSSKLDLLTGLQSRVALSEILSQEQSRSQSSGKAFSLIMADIDHISDINDEFGVTVGDQVIIRTGDVLQENLRSHDVVGRWSSEEFLIFLPETGLEDAQILAEKIRGAIENEKLDFNQKQIPLTLSIGVNHCSTGMKWEKCLAGAHECLKQAKKNRSE